MSDYNRDNAKGKYVPDKEDFIKSGAVGDWSFDRDGDTVVAIFLNTPDGSLGGAFARLPLVGSQAWQWDGSLDAPTLTPSIDRHPNWNKPGWHGYLTNGELRSV